MKQMIALWSMVKVHGLMVAGSCLEPEFKRSWGRGVAEAPGAFGNRKSNVGLAQPGGMDEPPGDFWTVNQMYSNSGG